MKAVFETVSLDTMIDNHIGKRGTEKRELFELELETELLSEAKRVSKMRSKDFHRSRALR